MEAAGRVSGAQLGGNLSRGAWKNLFSAPVSSEISEGAGPRESEGLSTGVAGTPHALWPLRASSGLAHAHTRVHTCRHPCIHTRACTIHGGFHGRPTCRVSTLLRTIAR